MYATHVQSTKLAQLDKGNGAVRIKAFHRAVVCLSGAERMLTKSLYGLEGREWGEEGKFGCAGECQSPPVQAYGIAGSFRQRTHPFHLVLHGL